MRHFCMFHWLRVARDFRICTECGNTQEYNRARNPAIGVYLATGWIFVSFDRWLENLKETLKEDRAELEKERELENQERTEERESMAKGLQWLRKREAETG